MDIYAIDIDTDNNIDVDGVDTDINDTDREDIDRDDRDRDDLERQLYTHTFLVLFLWEP